MSHFKERAQKSCLNCNAMVHGRFCHVCGQENIEPKETIWHLISHFFQDITHFDGKFFSTLRFLVFRPGHLSREYMLGRRASYLNPIRMYVFTSAFFFLFFFNMVGTVDMGNKEGLKERQLELEKATVVLNDLKDNLTNYQSDSVHTLAVKKAKEGFEARMVLMKATIDSLQVKDSLKKAKQAAKEDSLAKKLQDIGIAPKRKFGKSSRVFSFSVDELTGFSTVAAYDSVQAQLPDSAKDGWWRRLWLRKGIDVDEKANKQKGTFDNKLLDKFIHTLPQMFFLSLPLYAFFLFVLYNRQKKYYYVNHAIFSIHVFCAIFILSFVSLLLAKFFDFGSNTLRNIYNLAFVVGSFFYQYKAMRNFYQQRRAKTIAKFIILSFVSFITVMALATIFFLISLWSI